MLRTLNASRASAVPTKRKPSRGRIDAPDARADTHPQRPLRGVVPNSGQTKSPTEIGNGLFRLLRNNLWTRDVGGNRRKHVPSESCKRIAADQFME